VELGELTPHEEFNCSVLELEKSDFIDGAEVGWNKSAISTLTLTTTAGSKKMLGGETPETQHLEHFTASRPLVGLHGTLAVSGEAITSLGFIIFDARRCEQLMRNLESSASTAVTDKVVARTNRRAAQDEFVDCLDFATEEELDACFAAEDERLAAAKQEAEKLESGENMQDPLQD